MRTHLKVLMMALVSAWALSAAGGVASALHSLSITGETTQTLNSRALTFGSSFVNVICEVTMVKTIARSVAKSEGAVFGRVTDVRVANCRASSGGATNVIILGIEAGNATLWLLKYKAFLGTLPTITGIRIRIENVQTKFEVSGVNCLYEGWVEGLASVSSGTVGNLRTIREERIEKKEGNFLCSTRGTFTATGAEGELVPLQTTRVTLI